MEAWRSRLDQAEHPAAGRRGARRARAAGWLEVARGARRPALGTVDRPRRAGEARGVRPAPASAHLGRPRAHRPRLPPSTWTSCWTRAGCRDRAPSSSSWRGAARWTRPCAPPPSSCPRSPTCWRSSSAPPIETHHHPPRGGPAAAAAGGDDRGDHLHRRRDQAGDLLRAAGRPGARGLGGELSQRGPRRARRWASRILHARLAPELCRQRARVPGHARARLHRARGDGRGHALHRRRRAAAVRGPLPGADPDRRPDGGAGAPRVSLLGCCGQSSASRACTCASARRTSAPSCAR